MDVYACDVCDYYYDPEYGDEESHIKAGTPFTRLPHDWVCPECGAAKKDFYKLEEDDSYSYEEDDTAYELRDD